MTTMDPNQFVKDPTTHSNYEDISTSHVHFNWTIDWKERRFVGSAVHTLIVHKPNVDRVIFDSSYLVIDHVTVGDKVVEHDLGPAHPVLGSPLSVPLPAGLQKGESIRVEIEYSTTKEGTAIGWLEKEQTAGKKFEYLFSQCQPIYARTLSPLQDTPSVKLTYSANVKSVLPVLLSAVRVSPPSEQVHGGKEVGVDIVEYVYEQAVRIPSYIIAIASGNLVYRAFPRLVKNGANGEPVKWRTGVWSEPELIEKAEWEFVEDTNRYVSTAENLITPYEFGVYDLLVLPPSFPYGGMENSCLTFVTPTLLAGDRSLVYVVGHEISHSWFGNNITTADSGHFWLNEGWTTWLERLLAQQLNGPAARDFGYIIGRKGLDGDLRRYGEKPETRRFQRMVIDYKFGEDPDEAYSQVPYEKGGNFLLYLERLLGGLDVFVPYAKDYVNTFRGKSIRTAQWKAHLYAYFQEHHGDEKIKLLDSVDWDAWFYGEGLSMPVEPVYDTTLANEAYALAKKWKDSENTPIGDVQTMFKTQDLDGFMALQKVVFLERLSDIGGSSLPLSHLQHLSDLYSLDTTPNIELRHRFYMLVLAANPSSPDGGAARWVKEAGQWVADPKMIKGRMKFCRPIFRSMGRVGDGEYAKKVWRENQVFFHPIARRLIDKDLGLA